MIYVKEVCEDNFRKYYYCEIVFTVESTQDGFDASSSLL